MVTLDLEDENIVENTKYVRILQSLGMPDEEIQEYYDRSKKHKSQYAGMYIDRSRV
jgi:hypothetical protein